MELPRIGLVEHPAPEHRDAILHLLRDNNSSIIDVPVADPVAIVLRQPADDAIVGGLWGAVAFDWLFIDLLFVPVNKRLRGLGSAMMRMAETVAGERGCVGVQLNTFSFEAPGFYKRIGYKMFGTLPNCPRGHERIYYFKLIADDCPPLARRH